jgi:hypothetical protein
MPIAAVKTQNCVLVALAAITGKQPNIILAEMLQWAGPDRQIIDVQDRLMWRAAYTDYLTDQGWKGTWEPCAIPPTALIILDGHAFAHVNVVLFDNGTQPRWNRKILAVFFPPSQEQQ